MIDGHERTHGAKAVPPSLSRSACSTAPQPSPVEPTSARCRSCQWLRRSHHAGSPARAALPYPLDRRRRQLHRHLDAERRRGLADDLAHHVAVDGGPGASRGQHRRVSGGVARGRTCRHGRPPQAAAVHSKLDGLAAAALWARSRLPAKSRQRCCCVLTFLMGFGAVLNDPAWQAITPEVVSRRNFAAGVAWNSAGFNVARAIGPAFGGLIIAAAGSGIAFLLNAVSFFGVIYFLYRWKRERGRVSSSALGHMMSTMFDGVRHMRGSQSGESRAGAQRGLQHLGQRIAGVVAAAGASVRIARLRTAARLLWNRRACRRNAHATVARVEFPSDALVSVSTAIFAFTTFAAPEWCTFRCFRSPCSSPASPGSRSLPA